MAKDPTAKKERNSHYFLGGRETASEIHASSPLLSAVVGGESPLGIDHI